MYRERIQIHEIETMLQQRSRSYCYVSTHLFCAFCSREISPFSLAFRFKRDKFTRFLDHPNGLGASPEFQVTERQGRIEIR